MKRMNLDGLGFKIIRDVHSAFWRGVDKDIAVFTMHYPSARDTAIFFNELRQVRRWAEANDLPVYISIEFFDDNNITKADMKTSGLKYDIVSITTSAPHDYYYLHPLTQDDGRHSLFSKILERREQ